MNGFVQDETGAAGQASTSTRRGASVVDLNTSAALPAVVGRHREAPTIVAAARIPGQSPNGKRSPTRTPGNARVGRATLTPMASQSSTWMRVPEISKAGRSGSPQTRMMMNVEGLDDPVDGWEIENCTTRVLRTPQDNCTQPCNISALQIRGSRIVTLAPNSFRIWELSLEDSGSSGLLFDFHPVCLLPCLASVCKFYFALSDSSRVSPVLRRIVPTTPHHPLMKIYWESSGMATPVFFKRSARSKSITAVQYRRIFWRTAKLCSASISHTKSVAL